MARRSLTLLHHLRAEIGRIADTAAGAIDTAWSAAWDRLTPAWQTAIAAATATAAQRGLPLSPWQLARIPDVADAATRTRRVLTPLAVVTGRHTVAAVRAAAEATMAAEPGILAAQHSDLSATAGRFSAMEMRARAAQIRADIETRARTSAASAATDTGPAVEQVFLRAVARPDPLAQVTAAFTGGRHRAVSTVQTETLDTYRAVAAHLHEANRTPAWVWVSTLDVASCVACWGMHGTVHPLREPGPLGHPGCRCARLPLWQITDRTGVPDAAARFAQLSRTDQIAVLGPGRFALYDTDRIGWTDLAVRRTNQGWRDSYVPRPLASLRQHAAQPAA